MPNTAQHLIIFDIDGTLTQTTHVDSKSFVNAVCDVLNVSSINTQWETYQYSTDSGVLNEIYTALFQRYPNEKEVDIIREAFVNQLKSAWSEDPTHFAAIPGAPQLFQTLEALPNWHVGIATGTWKQCALFKLAAAMIIHDEIPKSYADDDIERHNLIKKTICLAKETYACHKFKRLIYVGDKDWDSNAARRLGMEFIGIGNGFLKNREFDFKLNDYTDLAPLVSFLQTPRDANL